MIDKLYRCIGRVLKFMIIVICIVVKIIIEHTGFFKMSFIIVG